MKLYIAGPMRGLPNYNFPMFDWARDHLNLMGIGAISPADHDRELGFVTEVAGVVETTDTFDINTVMRWDLAQVAGADGILLLPGWEDSSGARHERYVAEACGLRIFHFVASWADKTGYYYEEKPVVIIGVAGYAQAGKDTVGRILKERGFDRLAFADALRDMLYALNPAVVVRTGTKFDVRHIVDLHGWEWAKAHTDIREYLQRLGTEAGRKVLGSDIWVRTAMAKVQPGGSYVFTDVRFPNEAKAIKDVGGEVWRVERPGTGPANDHPSETALDDWDYDFVLHNNLDFIQLEWLVENRLSAPVAG